MRSAECRERCKEWNRVSSPVMKGVELTILIDGKTSEAKEGEKYGVRSKRYRVKGEKTTSWVS